MNTKDVMDIIVNNAYDAYNRRKEAEAKGDKKIGYIHLVRYASLLEIVCQIKNCNEDEAEFFILNNK